MPLKCGQLAGVNNLPPAASPANAKKSPPDPPTVLVPEPDCKRISEAGTLDLSVLAAEIATKPPDLTS